MIDANKNNTNRKRTFRLLIVPIVVASRARGAESFSIVGYKQQQHHRQFPTGAATRLGHGQGLQIRIRTSNQSIPSVSLSSAPSLSLLRSACTCSLLGDASKKYVVLKRKNCIERGRTRTMSSSALSSSSSALSLSANANANNLDDNDGQRQPSHNNNSSSSRNLEKRLSMFTFLTPLWTILAACLAVWKASWCSNVVGSLSVMQKAYAILMFVMGLSITPKDLKRALRQPKLLSINALLCFGMMPLLAAGIAKGFSYPSGSAIGLILLGSVSGGQASNLFTLIAGGDVALSVICTISTTLLGVVATPFLVQLLLGCSVAVDGRGVLTSILSMVLVPLFAGSAISRIFQDTSVFTQKVSRFLPTIGVLSTLVLVAGGSSNSIVSLSTTATATTTATSTSAALISMVAVATQGTSLASVLVPSCLLSVLGGAIAFWITKYALQLEERTKRTLVVETLSKSPTLAYILALKHFGSDGSVATIPGAAMVTLAVIGALVASTWSMKSKSQSPSTSISISSTHHEHKHDS